MVKKKPYVEKRRGPRYVIHPKKSGLRNANGVLKQSSSYLAYYYDINKSKFKQLSRDRANKNRAYVAAYLKTHPCIGDDINPCPYGETDPEVLQFDHRIPGTKNFRISGAAGRTLNDVKKEIARCDVRCANCHARRTKRQWREGTFRLGGRGVQSNPAKLDSCYPDMPLLELMIHG